MIRIFLIGKVKPTTGASFTCGIHFVCKYIPNYVHIQVHIAHFNGFSMEKNVSSLIKMVIKAHLKTLTKKEKKQQYMYLLLAITMKSLSQWLYMAGEYFL